MLTNFKNNYIKYCQDNKYESQESVLKALRKSTISGSGVILNLSGLSLSSTSCHAISKALEIDDEISSLLINDCMLADDCAELIIRGLSKHIKCVRFEAKGNQLRTSSARCFSHLLKYNKRLTHICLEWNSLGMIDEGMSDFSDGLSCNTSLLVLDLRNNQISMDGARHLASALKRNTTLLELDLRWNNCGLVGCKALSEALDSNKTLTRLELAGNNCPGDLLRAIDTSIGSNADRAGVFRQCKEEKKLLTRQLAAVQKDKQVRLADSMRLLEMHEESTRASEIATRERITSLQDALHERHSLFEGMSSKLTLNESELALLKSKNDELCTLLETTREERSAIVAANNLELKNERDNHLKIRAKLEKELTTLTEKLLNVDNKNDHLQKQLDHERNVVIELKEQIVKLNADLRIVKASADERIASERSKFKLELRDEVEAKNREFSERIDRIERERQEIEDEFKRATKLSTREKLDLERALTDLRKTLKSEMETKLGMNEERVKCALLAKDELQSQLVDYTNNLSESRLTISQLQRTNQQLQSRMDEMSLMFEQVKVERNEQSLLKERLHNLEKQLNDSNKRHSDNEDLQRDEISRLNRKLRNREEEVEELRREFNKRAKVLQEAVTSYALTTS